MFFYFKDSHLDWHFCFLFLKNIGPTLLYAWQCIWVGKQNVVGLSLCCSSSALFFNSEIPVRDNFYSPTPIPTRHSRLSSLVYWGKPTRILWVRILLKTVILGFLALNILTYAGNAAAGMQFQNWAWTAVGSLSAAKLRFRCSACKAIVTSLH